MCVYRGLRTNVTKNSSVAVTLAFVYFLGSVLGIYTCVIIAQMLLMITITLSALLELNVALDELVSALDRTGIIIYKYL